MFRWGGSGCPGRPGSHAGLAVNHELAARGPCSGHSEDSDNQSSELVRTMADWRRDLSTNSPQVTNEKTWSVRVMEELLIF